jgi:hypothetical protein
MAESAIGLKTFFEFDGRSPPRMVTIKNPDFFLEETGVRLPKSGITFLYGFKGSQMLLGNAIQRAMQKGSELCLVNGQSFVGTYTVDKQDLSRFGDFRFMNIPNQINAATKKDLKARWRELLDKYALEDDFPRRPSPHMFLLDELVTQERYNKLTAIAYEVETSIGPAQLVTVFKLNDIHNVEANSIHPVKVEIDLPS